MRKEKLEYLSHVYGTGIKFEPAELPPVLKVSGNLIKDNTTPGSTFVKPYNEEFYLEHIEIFKKTVLKNAEEEQEIINKFTADVLQINEEKNNIVNRNKKTSTITKYGMLLASVSLLASAVIDIKQKEIVLPIIKIILSSNFFLLFGGLAISDNEIPSKLNLISNIIDSISSEENEELKEKITNDLKFNKNLFFLENEELIPLIEEEITDFDSEIFNQKQRMSFNQFPVIDINTINTYDITLDQMKSLINKKKNPSKAICMTYNGHLPQIN